MATNDSGGEGRFIGCKCASTTSSILPGRILEYNSNGSVTLPTTTPNVDQLAGVSVTKTRTRTSASEEDIVVQTSGMTDIVCAANSAFSRGKFVRAATAGTGAGYASTAAEATTITSTALAACIGKVVVPDATTTGTTVVVNVNNL